MGKRIENSVGIDKKYVDCISSSENEELKCSMSFDQSNLFTKTGKKLTMMADSEERLELWWKFEWLGSGYILPRLNFVLFYFNPYGTEKQKRGVKIGKCRFSRGCNYGRYSGPDLNKNGIPDFFSEIVWDNWDYGIDMGEPGYLDHYQHIYRPPKNHYEVIRYLYLYPEKCSPPMSPADDICNLYDECKPPYKIIKKTLVEGKSF